MNELTLFSNLQFGSVRTIDKDGEPWFVATDVMEVFKATNRNRLMQSLDPDEKGYTQMSTPGGPQQKAVVNEFGLYSLLFAMQPTKARGVSDEYVEKRCTELKAFKRWITHEVIPTIRRHGMYATPQTLEQMLADPETLIVTLQALKAEREQRRFPESRA